MKRIIVILILIFITLSSFGDESFFDGGELTLLPQMNLFGGEVLDSQGNIYTFYSQDLKKVISADEAALGYYNKAMNTNFQATVYKGFGLGLEVISIFFIALAAQDYQTFISNPLVVVQKPEGITGLSGFVVGSALYMIGYGLEIDAQNSLLKSVTLFNK